MWLHPKCSPDWHLSASKVKRVKPQSNWWLTLLCSAVSSHVRGGGRRSVRAAGSHRSAPHQVRFPQHHHPGGALLWRHAPLLPLPGPQWLSLTPGAGPDREPAGHGTGSQAHFFHPLWASWTSESCIHKGSCFKGAVRVFGCVRQRKIRRQNHLCVGSQGADAGAPC